VLAIENFDEQAARWSSILAATGVVLHEICPFAAPRWLAAHRLYLLCSNTSIGLDRAARLISATVEFADRTRAATEEKESVPCHLLSQM
jgi:hypothetical protein